MTHRRTPNHLVAAWAVVLGSLLVASSAQAVSSTSSEISGSVSTSVGKSSDSIGNSSDSSSKGKRDVAEGDYRVVQVAELADKPGTYKLTLAPADETMPSGSGFDLLLPRAALDRAAVQAGSVVNARLQPYGVAFSARADRQPFFLVVHDEWYRELNSRAVTL